MSINGLATTHYERGDLTRTKKLYEQYLEIEHVVDSKINTAVRWAIPPTSDFPSFFAEQSAELLTRTER
jgi:hypothetical protein